METKHKIFNLVILDESGSMEAVRSAVIIGINELAETIRIAGQQYPGQEHLISLITFNGQGIRTLFWNDPVTGLDMSGGPEYKPYGATPLYEAMGYGISRLRNDVKLLCGYNVLVTVIANGHDNASIEYRGRDVKKLVEELAPGNWTFTYMGANHDVAGLAMQFSIANTKSFEATAADVLRIFREESIARLNYSRKIRDNEDFRTGYFMSAMEDNRE